MPYIIDDALVEVAAEVSKEVVGEAIRELATESIREAYIQPMKELMESTRLSPHELDTQRLSIIQNFASNAETHKISVNDIQDVVLEAKGKSPTRQVELLGDRLSRAELISRDNKLIEVQPNYGINPETNYPYRADALFETKPGSTYREINKIGDTYIANEHVCAGSEKLLIDVKNHSVTSLRTNLKDTLSKIDRMKSLSLETIPTISLPEDVAINPRAFESIEQIVNRGAKIITHASYDNSIRTALLLKRTGI